MRRAAWTGFAPGLLRAMHLRRPRGDERRAGCRRGRLVGTDSTPSLTSIAESRDGVEGVLTESLTITGQVLGSPNNMPPEQASASKGKVGRYSDVYSLGRSCIIC